MHNYLEATQHAAKNLIELAAGEFRMLEDLRKKFLEANSKFEHHNWDYTSTDMNDDFSEGHVRQAFGKMAEAHREMVRCRAAASSLQAILDAKEHALQFISGTVLQLALQGISVVYGKTNEAPLGRKIGSQYLRDVVSAARNQAAHFDEEDLRPAVKKVFSILESEFGDEFSIAKNPHKILAQQVLLGIGWDDYAQYLKDMEELLAPE